MCVAARNSKNSQKAPGFEGLRSFKVIDVNIHMYLDRSSPVLVMMSSKSMSATAIVYTLDEQMAAK